MATESAEQVRERHFRDMGSELGAIYHALWNEVAWLHAKWNPYRKVYAHSPERVAFLNTVAGHFFGVIQDTMYDDVLLHLTRLIDPTKNNLTLRALPKLVRKQPALAALASDLERRVRDAERACGSALVSRNERIAHRDLERALAGIFEPDPGRASVEIALRAVRAVLHRLEAHYWQSETGY